MRLFGTVLGPGEAEQTIERSRFICYVSPAESREEAEEIIRRVTETVEYLRSFSPVWRNLREGRIPHIL